LKEENSSSLFPNLRKEVTWDQLLGLSPHYPKLGGDRTTTGRKSVTFQLREKLQRGKFLPASGRAGKVTTQGKPSPSLLRKLRKQSEKRRRPVVA